MALVCKAAALTPISFAFSDQHSVKCQARPTTTSLALGSQWTGRRVVQKLSKEVVQNGRQRCRTTRAAWNPFQAKEMGPPMGASYEASAPPYPADPIDTRVPELVVQKLKATAAGFRRWGTLGFWVQLICSLVSATILAFSVVVTGEATNQATFYLTAAGIVLAFISTFWSWGYRRLAARLQDSAADPSKAPSKTSVVRNLSTGIVLNMVGLAATLLGAQATTGLLVAKSLTSQQQPYLANVPQGFAPVLALDVFLVQASFNVVLSHFFGLLFNLLLLRSVTLSQPPSDSAILKPA